MPQEGISKMANGKYDPKDQELDETKKQATEETDDEGFDIDGEGQGALVD